MKRKILFLILICVLVLIFAACSTDIPTEKTVVRIQVQHFPSSVYYVQEPLNLKDSKLLVTYSDGTTESVAITQNMISGYESEIPKEQSITIKYGNHSTTTKVIVKNYVLQGIKLENKNSPNSKINIDIMQGATLILDDYRLRLFFDDGHSALVDKVEINMLTNFSTELQPGSHNIIVKYENFTDSFTLNISANDIKDIYVHTNGIPTKKDYVVGESFNPQGLILTLEYTSGLPTTIPYNEDNKTDFVFDYDFSVARGLSPITLTYKDTWSCVFNVSVKEPQCIGMSFDYEIATTDENGDTIVTVVNGRPKTHGVIINGERQSPSSLDSMIAGDTIDWESGSAMLYFEFGEPKVIDLTDTALISNISSYDITKPGNYTIELYYGNVSWRTQLSIVVHAKSPMELLLHDTQAVTDKTYIVGDKVMAEHIKYNVLFNNGEYLFSQEDDTKIMADHTTWAYIDFNSMLSVDSSHNCTTAGIQTITYQYESVSASLEIRVVDLEYTDVNIVAPIKDYYAVGALQDQVDFTDGTLFITFNNNNFIEIPLTDMDITIDYYLEGVLVDNFDVAGDYQAVISYLIFQEICQFTVYVRDVVVESISVKNLPQSIPTYFNFNQIQLDELTLEIVYSNYQTQEIALNEDMLYNPNKLSLGYQDVVVRYQGALTSFPVYIEGKREVALELTRAPKSIYIQGVDNQINLQNLVINILYNDGSLAEKRSFSESKWIFELLDRNTRIKTSLDIVGKKVIVIKYGELTIEHNIEVVTNQVTKIAFDDTQSQMRWVEDGGVSRYMLLVSRGQSLNVHGMTLQVYYEGLAMPVDVELLASYILYDKTLDVYDTNNNNQLIRSRELEINFGGKKAYIWIHIVERQLTSITIQKTPNTIVYAEGQDIKLVGGSIRRYFNDGSNDVLSMTNGAVIITGYDKLPFINISNPAIRSITQTVTIIYNNEQTTFDVITYRKLNAEENISYNDAASFYGDVKVPSIQIAEQVAGFVLPEWSLEYQDVSGNWVLIQGNIGIYPKLPGTYPLRVNIVGNEYYNSSVIENKNLIIMKKIIDIRVNDAIKFYSMTDPIFTYWTEGDTINENGETINTFLVISNGVQDKLEIIIEREIGENVRFSSTGAILGYSISARLAPSSSNNQNDRYLVDFKSGELKIMPMVLESTVHFSTNNLYEDGRSKPITASYTVGGVSLVIAQRDIIYKDENDNVLPSAPSARGNYTATISDNYIIESGNRTVSFTINPPR